MSAVLYIIGGFVSLNLIDFCMDTLWRIVVKNKEALKGIVIEKNNIGNTWWIILAIAGVLGLLSVHGFNWIRCTNHFSFEYYLVNCVYAKE